MTRKAHACAAVVMATLVLAACDSTRSGTATLGNQGAGDPVVSAALSRYVVGLLRRYPTMNTYLGGGGLDPSLAGVDGTLRDYSPAAIQDEDQWLAMTARELGAISADALTDAVRIDRDVAVAQIRFLLHLHQVRHYQERAVDTYVGEPFRAIDWQIQGLTETSPGRYGTREEWDLIVQRVHAIPQFLATARRQMELGGLDGRVADWRMLQRDGLDTSEANAKYFAETLPRTAMNFFPEDVRGPNSPELVSERLKRAGRDASAAYMEFHDFLAKTYFEPGARTIKAAYAADRFAFGESEYNWALQNNLHLDTTAAKLFDESAPIVEATRQQMIALARQIGQQHAWPLPVDGPAAVRAVFDQLSKDYPANDAEMIAWYRDAAFRLVDYARRTGLFDVPADYKLDVVETPPPLLASVVGASYYPAPPFKKTGVGRFYVSPTHNDPAALQNNNRAALADLAAHEGFPGHDWYYKVLTQTRGAASPVRWLTPGAVEDSSAMWEDSAVSEGWGLYAEGLMAEPQPGATNGFYSPEERLYQLQGELFRDLRVRIDVGIHTGRLGYDAATSMYSETVDFLPGPCDAAGRAASASKRASCENAEDEIFRYSKWPTQALTYRIGKDQIVALRRDAAQQSGSTFSAKRFHLQFIAEGTIPSGYFRTSLLKELAAPE